MIKASVELQVPVSVDPLGIRVGDSVITWGYLLDVPGVRDRLKSQLCTEAGCARKVEVRQPALAFGVRVYEEGPPEVHHFPV